MYAALSTGRLQFAASPDRLIDLASTHGFAAVEAPASVFLSSREDGDRFAGRVRDAGLAWATTGMPASVSTRSSDAEFDRLVDALRELAPRLAAAGVTTMSAWLMPADDVLPFEENLALHVRRLDVIEPILRESGLRLALEYVGPATMRAPYRHDFISSLSGMCALIDALAQPATFGHLLDTFHWYTAGDTLEAIRALSGRDVLAVDLNDAPRGLAREQQLDLERAQPCTTGVIDAAAFLATLRDLGAVAPVYSEPFSTDLRAQPDDQRVIDARNALKRAGVDE